MKTGDSERGRGFESHLLRLWYFTILYILILFSWRSTQVAEGAPLERVQVVNSGARVQIPPSPFFTVGIYIDVSAVFFSDVLRRNVNV